MTNHTTQVEETRRRLRAEMPAAERWAYLDHAAMCPLPRPTAAMLEAWLTEAVQIGNPVSVRKAIRALQKYDGIVEQASEQELADASAEADRTGMFNCPHTGVALAVLKKLVARKQIESGQRVVVISTANGLKFTDFKIGYHEERLPGIRSHHANHPLVLPNDYDAVVRAIDHGATMHA